LTALLWCTLALDLVAGGEARARLETDASPAASAAAETLRRHAVRMTGVAVPRGSGAGPAVRFATTDFPGYEIRVTEDGAVVAGDDPLRAAYDLLRAWGCRFGPDEAVPRRETLPVRARRWRRERVLYRAAHAFDPSFPAEGIAVHGLDAYRPQRLAEARALGRRVRVASTSFDDFLPVALFEAHPEWFARRGGERTPRGNFDLTNDAARAALLDRLGRWLEDHPEVDVLGLWPEVTRVWDEGALELGAPDAYALLWREAAARFPDRGFEILATGLTLRPPATGGRVPDNVEVRLRPGRDASGLQPIAGQRIEPIVHAWEARGARVVLEIDGAPDSFCGMPWPCHAAVRGNARRFPAAVLRGGGRALAAIWHDPGAPLGAHVDEATLRLVERARDVVSWGHPADAANLFAEPGEAGDGDAFRIAAVERLFRLARGAGGDEARTAAHDLFLAYAAVRRALPPEHAATYRRYRGRAYRALVERVLPGGVTHDVGPATVTEDFDRVVVELPRLRLGIDRRTATVTSLRRRLADGWSKDLAGEDGHFFAVTALAEKVRRSDGEVTVTSPATGRVRIVLAGRLSRDHRFGTTLELGGDGHVRQRSNVTAPGGIACGSRWTGGPLDRWICPAYAADGRFGGGRPRRFALPPRTLLFARAGERGPGLALRVGDAARTLATVVPDPAALVAAARGARRMAVDWIVFSAPAELGHAPRR